MPYDYGAASHREEEEETEENDEEAIVIRPYALSNGTSQSGQGQQVLELSELSGICPLEESIDLESPGMAAICLLFGFE